MVEARVATWVDVVAELLVEPIHEFPIGVVGRGLIETFDADVASKSWRTPEGRAGLQPVARRGASLGGHEISDTTATMLRAANSDLVAHHPLVRWYARAGAPSPQTIDRVPGGIRLTRRLGEVMELLRAHGVDRQLWIPLAIRGPALTVLTVARAGRDDFTDDDLRVATRLAPLFRSIHRQAEVLEQRIASRHPFSLSGRELAVLGLVAEGRTSLAIASQLGCSPRTVEKHLEHMYRKLDVSDKVSAIREARAAGVLFEVPAHLTVAPRAKGA